jgi:hypothetical protein
LFIFTGSGILGHAALAGGLPTFRKTREIVNIFSAEKILYPDILSIKKVDENVW